MCNASTVSANAYQESGRQASRTLGQLCKSVGNATTRADCEGLDLTVVLPGDKDHIEVDFSCGALDLADLRHQPHLLQQLPAELQLQGLQMEVPVQEVILAWESETLFELCVSVAGVIETVMKVKTHRLIHSDILACRHITVPFKKQRCKRLDTGLRASIAKMTEHEYSRFKKRLQHSIATDAANPTPCHRHVATREDLKQVKSYIGSLRAAWNTLAPTERNLWLTADAGVVGFEQNLCSAAVLGYNGPSCWLTPQVRLANPIKKS